MLVPLGSTYVAGSWHLLLRLRDVANGFFQPTLRTTGLENEHNRQANTYSRLGRITQPQHYKDPIDQKYAFKLVFTYTDKPKDTLIWKQSSWPTTSNTITGYQPLVVPNQATNNCEQFKGLAISSSSSTYLDGNGNSGCWWNSVGSIKKYGSGIPGFNGKLAKAEALYIFRPPGSQAHTKHETFKSTSNHIVRGDLVGEKDLRDFEAAKRLCRYHYGDMVSIQNDNDNRDVLALCQELGGNCWIGLQAEPNPKTWDDVKTWVNGQPYGTYKHWQPGEPNNAGQNEKCTEMYTSGTWNDIPCTMKKRAICKKVEITQYDNFAAVAKEMNMNAAKQWCKTNYGSSAGLATIKSFEQNEAVRKACSNLRPGTEVSCWLGFAQDPTQSFAKWDDEEKSNIEFTKWLDTYPKKQSGLDCGIMLVTKDKFGWANKLCSDNAFFICSKGSHASSAQPGNGEPHGDLQCPTGAVEIGRPGKLNDIGGCGLEACDNRYSITSIQACRDRCTVMPNGECKAFSWAPVGGDKNHVDKTVCTVYNSDVPTQEWGPKQIMCGIGIGNGNEAQLERHIEEQKKHMEEMKEGQEKHMESMKDAQQKGLEEIKQQHEQHKEQMTNKLNQMHRKHLNKLDTAMKKHRKAMGKHVSGMKEALLREMRNSFNKNNEQSVLLQKIDDIKHQQTELELQHKMLESRKKQKDELDKQTNVIMQKQMEWEKKREIQRQKRMRQREKLSQQQHEMRLDEHYQMMNGLKGFLMAFGNLYNNAGPVNPKSAVSKPKPKTKQAITGRAMPGGRMYGMSGGRRPGMSGMPGQTGGMATQALGGDAKRYETRWTKFAHFNRPPPLLPPIPPLPPRLASKNNFLGRLPGSGLSRLTSNVLGSTNENSEMMKELQAIMDGQRRRLINDDEFEDGLHFVEICKCKFDVKFGELCICMKYNDKNNIISFDIVTPQRKELKLKENRNILSRDTIDTDDKINDFFLDKNLVFFDSIKANIGFNIWKYELLDYKYIKNENKTNNVIKYGQYDNFDDYVHHFIVYQFEFILNETFQCRNNGNNDTLPFDVCLKVNESISKDIVIYFDKVDKFEMYDNDKLTKYMQQFETFEFNWMDNDKWDEIISFDADNQVKKCANLAITKLCVNNKIGDNLYVVDVKLQLINQVINS